MAETRSLWPGMDSSDVPVLLLRVGLQGICGLCRCFGDIAIVLGVSVPPFHGCFAIGR